MLRTSLINYERNCKESAFVETLEEGQNINVFANTMLINGLIPKNITDRVRIPDPF
jgi:hypothetical protein